MIVPHECTPFVHETRDSTECSIAEFPALQHDVSNRAAVPKRAHTAGARAHAAAALLSRQCCELHRQRARHAPQRTTNVRIEQPQLRIRRRLASTQPERQLEQPSHARCWLGVPDVGLDTAHRQHLLTG